MVILKVTSHRWQVWGHFQPGSAAVGATGANRGKKSDGGMTSLRFE
jgi:hypothetical protein